MVYSPVEVVRATARLSTPITNAPATGRPSGPLTTPLIVGPLVVVGLEDVLDVGTVLVNPGTELTPVVLTSTVVEVVLAARVVEVARVPPVVPTATRAVLAQALRSPNATMTALPTARRLEATSTF